MEGETLPQRGLTPLRSVFRIVYHEVRLLWLGGKMDKNYKQLKLWQGLVVLAFAALIIFVVSPKMLAPFGLYGTLLAEWLMLAGALLLVLVFRGDPKQLFPVKRPSAGGILGTVLMWVGALLIEMTLVLLLSIFFPERILNVNIGLSTQMINVPFIAAFLIVAVTPAICEEAIFRGVFLRSMNPEKHRWAAIVVCAAVFGIFHGDPVRFVPTAIGGAVMAYILLESENMVYNSIFHFINNLLPIILLFGMSGVYEKLGVWDSQGSLNMAAVQGSYTFMLSAGLYMMMCAAAPSCLYIGNYLLHSGRPGYRDKLFPGGKPGIVIFLVAASGMLFIGGLVLFLFGMMHMPVTLI